MQSGCPGGSQKNWYLGIFELKEYDHDDGKAKCSKSPLHADFTHSGLSSI